MIYKSLLDLVHWNYVILRPNNIDLSRDRGWEEGGGNSHIKVTVSFGVFETESHYICPFRYPLGLCIKKFTKKNAVIYVFLYCLL